MDSRQAKPSRIHHVGGRDFLIHQEFDDLLGQYIPVYPDFEENPEYTDDGKPFKLSLDEGCSSFQSAHKENSQLCEQDAYSDCGCCCFFYRGETPLDLIGICTCSALQKKQ